MNSYTQMQNLELSCYKPLEFFLKFPNENIQYIQEQLEVDNVNIHLVKILFHKVNINLAKCFQCIPCM